MEAKRTLVKSPPELWAELSDVAALARHLGEFGEIRITRTEPEAVVEWEGDHATGTVRLEPSGWGTRVTLTAQVPSGDRTARPPGDEPVQTPPGEAAPAAPPKGWRRLTWWRRRAPEPPPPEPPPPEPPPPEPPPPEPPPPEPPPPEPPLLDEERAVAVLRAVLDALGRAHHRPFSR